MNKLTLKNVNDLNFAKDKDGLVPTIIQNINTNEVLMLGYSNLEAIQLTLNTNNVHFWSRSKNRIWMKGESSNNTLFYKEGFYDCDKDTLIYNVTPNGPTCHLGTSNCFNTPSKTTLLTWLESVIKKKKLDDSDKSYTAKMLSKTTDKIAKKVGEEGVEVALASVLDDTDEFIGECADLIYHLMLLLEKKGLSINDVNERLLERNQPK